MFYLEAVEVTGKMYIDAAGRFLVPSTKGNPYILANYNLDSNHIFAKLMKDRKKESQIQVVSNIIQRLKRAGLKPTFHVLDNKVSGDLITFLEDQYVRVQLAPAGYHRRNVAERAIRMFQNHFIAGLCTADNNSPLNKWDSLLP